MAPKAVGPAQQPLTEAETYAQRIIYFHVPSAWLSMLAFGVTMIASVAYLVTSKRRWDSLAVSSAEIGLVFVVAATASGSVWAKPAWNVWWTWDPRLTTYTILFLLYVAYFMLRSAMEDPARRARFAAVYGIFAFLSVPITFMSIRWWRTIHPVLIDPKEGFGLTPHMLIRLLLQPGRLHPVLRRAPVAPLSVGADQGAGGSVAGRGRVLARVTNE